MNISEEVEEYRAHIKSLKITGNALEILTLEDFLITVEVTSEGYFITSSSAPISQDKFDDLGQLLTTLSPRYRDSFSQELYSKLLNLS